MSKLARARVKVQRKLDARQDNRLRKLQLKTNKALKQAKENEATADAQDKLAKATAKNAAAKRRKNAARSERNEKAIKSFKKFGRQFLKQVRKQ